MFQGSILLHLPPALNRLQSSEKIMVHILRDINDIDSVDIDNIERRRSVTV